MKTRQNILLLAAFFALLSVYCAQLFAYDNLFPEGDMENVVTVPGANPDLPAVPKAGAPPGWSSKPENALSVTKESHSGKYALKISSKKNQPVIVNYFLKTQINNGVVTFYYKINTPEPEGKLIFYAISFAGKEVNPRASLPLNIKETKDGKWRKAELRFNFKTPYDNLVLAFRMGCEGADEIDCDWIIDDIEVKELGPELSIDNVKTQKFLAVTGREFFVFVQAANSGGGSLEGAKIKIEGIEAAGAKESELEAVTSGKSTTVSWKVKPKTPGLAKIVIRGTVPGQEEIKRIVEVPVIDRYPELSLVQDLKEGVTIDKNFAAISEKESVLLFPRSVSGFMPGLLYMKKDGKFLLVGNTGILHQIYYQGRKGMECLSVLSQNAEKLVNEGKERLVLNAKATDLNGTVWNFRYSVSLNKDGMLDVSNSACPEKDAEVYNFKGPWLVIGEDSFGAKRDTALFPGVEYLTKEEQSSNYLYDAPPLDKRYVPPAYYPTIPLMALETPAGILGILWDQTQEWVSGERYPRQYFSSPEANNTDVSVMGLFGISSAHKSERNLIYPKTPFIVKKQQAMEIRASFFTMAEGIALDAVDAWIARFGMPSMPQTKGFKEELEWMGDSAKPVWPSLRTELQSSYNEAKKSLKTQNPDGSWGYVRQSKAISLFAEGSPYRKMNEQKAQEVGNPDAFTFDWYGKPGDVASGISAWEVRRLMKAALLSGDPYFLEAGLKGLDCIKKNFKRPEGGQVWEVPLHAPDILPAAMLVEAYISAYKCTGNKDYISDAVYWARTGLPFVYLWRAHDRSVMAYGTIPIFGTSVFVVNWRGNLVQWCGMWYARALLYLSEYDSSRPWRKIGEGITRCCMQQQVYYGDKDRKRWFYYPDNWDMVTDRYGGVDINPGDIKKNIKIMLGHPEIQTRLIAVNDGSAFVSSEAEITEAKAEGTILKITLGEGPETNHLSVGKNYIVKEAKVNGIPVPEVKNFSSAGIFRHPFGLAIISSGSKSAVELVLEKNNDLKSPVVKESRDTGVSVTGRLEWTFSDPKAVTEWVDRPNHNIEIKESAGTLKMEPFGNDPFIYFPDLEFKAEDFPYIIIKMKATKTKESGHQIFFVTEASSDWEEAKSIRSVAIDDDKFYIYTFDMGKCGAWKGKITGLRLDPFNGKDEIGCIIEIEYIKLGK